MSTDDFISSNLPEKSGRSGQWAIRMAAVFLTAQSIYYGISAEFYFLQVYEKLDDYLDCFFCFRFLQEQNETLFFLYFTLMILGILNAIDLLLFHKRSRTRTILIQTASLFSFILIYYSPFETQSIYIPMLSAILMIIFLHSRLIQSGLDEKNGGKKQ